MYYSKIILSLIVLLSVSNAHAEDDDHFWTNFIKDTVDVSAGKIENVEFVMFKKDGVDFLKIKNGSSGSIKYSGYGETPQLFIRELKDEKWIDAGWDWCGTGLSEQVIESGKEKTINVGESIKGRKYIIVNDVLIQASD